MRITEAIARIGLPVVVACGGVVADGAPTNISADQAGHQQVCAQDQVGAWVITHYFDPKTGERGTNINACIPPGTIAIRGTVALPIIQIGGAK